MSSNNNQMGYTIERNIQIVISLLKQNNIKKIVTSPGATNVTFVGSMQNDPFFEMYSCVDERSAAYMACGLAAESQEPVVLSCTGATSSRNYLPALTDAYYRKLPVLAITSSQFSSRIGQMTAQVTDRTCPPVDCITHTCNLETCKDADDEWNCTIKANEAISCLTKWGGGPVHINLVTNYSADFSLFSLPKARVISRIDFNSEFPELPSGNIAIFVGAHKKFSSRETQAIDRFCAQHNAVVLCDNASNFYGKYRVQMALPLQQSYYYPAYLNLSLLIHIGEITGDYTIGKVKAKQVWRISEDGEIRDFFHSLTKLFNMPELCFFQHYTNDINTQSTTLLDLCNQDIKRITEKIKDIPFSNVWIAQQTSPLIPVGSQVHLGILNSLRSWNLFPFENGVESISNVGGFGIDGCMSTLIGASLVHQEKLYFGVFGDLSFFYDVNAILTPHLSGNLRILIVNNGRGTEFRLYNHIANVFGEDADKYMAAAGHFGSKSFTLLRDLAIQAGFEYISASTKEEYLQKLECFVSPQIKAKPVIFEVFTETPKESDAIAHVSSLDMSSMQMLRLKIISVVSKSIGEKGIQKLRMLRKK